MSPKFIILFDPSGPNLSCKSSLKAKVQLARYQMLVIRTPHLAERMSSALRDAVPDGVSLKDTFQRLLLQAEADASTSCGVCTFGLRTICDLRPSLDANGSCASYEVLVCPPWHQ